MATRYWVGGTGWWNETSHWSTSSGGSGGASVPTSADDAVFDSASGGALFNVYVTDTGVDGSCNDISLTANTYAKITLSVPASERLLVYGNLSISTSVMTSAGFYAATQGLQMVASSGSKTIDTNSKTFGNIVISGGATYTALSDIVCTTGDDNDIFSVSAGVFDLNGKNLTTPAVSVTGTGDFRHSSGTVTLTGTNIAPGSLTVGASASYDADKTGTTVLSNTAVAYDTLANVTAKTMGTLKLAPSMAGNYSCSCAGGVSITSLVFDATNLGASDSSTFRVATSGVVTVAGITATVATASKNKVASATGGVRGSLAVSVSPKIRPANISFKDILVSSGGPILAASSCVDNGNNAGILFGRTIQGFGALL